jgi:phosphatidylserine decarboxylase
MVIAGESVDRAVSTMDASTILAIQSIILVCAAVVVTLWAVYLPAPSPLIRRWFSPRKRWPEGQIRGWLANGRFQRAFLDYFNRDPERVAPAGDSILAPADGLVTSADVRGCTRYLVIALSFWDMHVQRSPVAGIVSAIEALGGDFMDGEGREFAFLREKHCPVQKRLVLHTSAGEVAIRLITSIAARRIETWVRDGDKVERGQRVGRILLGSTVVLELPSTTPLLVKVGERVRAGETVIAEALSTS